MDIDTVDKPGGPWPQTGRGVQEAGRWIIHSILERVISLRNHPIVRGNFPIVILSALYIFAIYGVHAIYSIRGKIVLTFYSDWFARLALSFMAVFVGLHLPKKAYKRYFTPRYPAGLFVILILAPLYKSSFASFKQTIPLINDFSWDIPLTRLDYVLHFGHHPWRLLEPILPNSR